MTDKEIMETKKYLKYGIDCDIFQEPVISYARTALWAFEEVNRQKAEIEWLHEVINGFEEQSHKEFLAYMELSEKYQNAKAILEEIENDINPLPFVTDFDVAIRNAKSEAIKEFAERLTDRICDAIEESSNNIDGENYFITDVYETINSLVNEMTEQKG